MSGLEVAVCVLAVAVGSLAQAVTGIGFSLMCAPFLSLALGGADGVRLANVLALGVNVLVLRQEWRLVDARQALRLLLPAVAVTPPAAWVAGRTGSDALSVVAGVLVLVAVAALARGLRIERLRGRAGAVVAGAASGVMNTMAGVGGPVVAAYTANAGWEPAIMRPTLAAYFLLLNVAAVSSRGVPELSAATAGALAGAVLGGFAVGAVVRRGLRPLVVRRVVLVLAAAGGAGAILQGL